MHEEEISTEGPITIYCCIQFNTLDSHGKCQIEQSLLANHTEMLDCFEKYYTHTSPEASN